MARIFISYRRTDSDGYAGRLYDRLSQHFGRNNLFMDIDTIEYGYDFVKAIEDAVSSCDVLLAIIGRQWLDATDAAGKRRLDNPEDFVRLEITTALERNIRVIPVLVGNTTMPRSTDLPEGLRSLTRRQALRIGDRFHPDVDHLIGSLDSNLSDLPIQVISSTLPPIHSVADFSTQTNSIGMQFVKIPDGTFTMGSPDSDPDADSGEKPVHQVTISKPFYLGKYEVTQAQWKAVMGNNPSYSKGDNLPVENVSWDDAQQFIKKLNEKEKRTDGLLYHLPTEAEWEYAARAGTTTIYSFGDDASQLGDYAWYVENAENTTHPAGQKRPNAWGLYDMHGNVWEWCQDLYGPYPAEAVTNPSGPDTAAHRVIRGGNWLLSARNARSAHRFRDDPALRLGYLGFRCLSSGVSQ